MKQKIFLFYAVFLVYLVSLTPSDGQSSTDRLPEGAIARFSPDASVYTVAFSPNGQFLASGGDDNAVTLWDIAEQREREVFIEHGDSVMSVAFSPDGQLLASASLDGFVRLWDVSSELKRTSLTHKGWVKSVAFSPDGETLASGGGDQEGSIILWDVSGSHRITTFPGHGSIVESVAFSSDGLLASAGRDKTVKLWDVTDQQLYKNLTKHKNIVYTVAFSPSGDVLATSSRDNTIRLWEVFSGENFATFEIGKDRYVYAEALAFSPDGKLLASACVDYTIILWNLEDRREVDTLRGHDGGVTSVAFSPDGKRLASGSRDRTVLLWDLSHLNIVPHHRLDPKPDPKPIIVDTTPPNIVILSPTEHVVPANTEQLPVRGEVTDDNDIGRVKVNGREVWISAEGRFTATVQIIEGKNEIRVTATDRHGNVDTERLVVVRSVIDPPPSLDRDPPTISLNVPSSTEYAEFTLQGSVVDDSSVPEVTVNNKVVSVSEAGAFITTVSLVEGENEIRVTATDRHGNMEAKRFRLLLLLPDPDLVGPVIRILSPVYDPTRAIKPIITIDADSTTIAGEVEDDNGVSEVRVDGRKVEIRGKYFEMTVLLDRGDNPIYVTATDTLGNKSDKEIIIFRPEPSPRKDYALLFAVEDYDYWDKLRKPIYDAVSIQQDLENLYGFQTKFIKNPTQAGIFKAIREYAEMDYTDDDQLLIFFAGHGYFDDTFKGGHLVARDTKLPDDDPEMLSYVSHSRLRDIIDRMNCKHILLVLDTCYSGTFDRLIAMRGGTDNVSRSLSEADIRRKFQYVTRWYLTSGGKEKVPDDSEFVRALLEALRSKGGADNLLTIDEVLSYLKQLDNPKPRASGFGSDEPGSDFLFFAIE